MMPLKVCGTMKWSLFVMCCTMRLWRPYLKNDPKLEQEKHASTDGGEKIISMPADAGSRAEQTDKITA